MPFDLGKFQAAEFRPRTQRVPVPALAAFFAEGEEAVWEVRGLSSAELHRAMEAKDRQMQMGSVVDAMSQNSDKTAALRKVLGLTSDPPAEMVKRIEMLQMGSVAPLIELDTAVKLAEAFPIELLNLTNTITALTGRGFDLVKPHAASQQTDPSTPA